MSEKPTTTPRSGSLTASIQKKAFEQKAFTPLGGYLTISLALFGAGGAVQSTPATQYMVWPLWATGAVFVFGTICFLLALKDKNYGAVASHPDMWLNRGTIDGPDTVLPTMLAFITFYHCERIDTSVEMNRHKARRIRHGIYAGIAAPVLFMLMMLVTR